MRHVRLPPLLLVLLLLVTLPARPVAADEYDDPAAAVVEALLERAGERAVSDEALDAARGAEGVDAWMLVEHLLARERPAEAARVAQRVPGDDAGPLVDYATAGRDPARARRRELLAEARVLLGEGDLETALR